METNRKNNILLIRALEKGLSGDPCPDFTARVMARVAKEPTARERRENRLLLIGAVMCALGLVVLGVCAFRHLPEAGFDLSFGETFERFGANVGNVGRELGGLNPAGVISRGPGGAEGDESTLLFWCYLAVLFLVLACTGQWLRSRHAGAVRK